MTKIAILGGVTALFTLTALALTSYHTEMRCHASGGGMSTNECPQEYEDQCPKLYAYGFQMEIDVYTANYKCPWRKETAILGLIGLSLTQIFLGLLFATVKGKALKIPMVALAGLIIPVLLSSFGLMVRDLKRGYNSAEAADEADMGMHHRPGTYLANIILLFLGVWMIAGAAFMGFSADADGASAKAPSGNANKSGNQSSNNNNNNNKDKKDNKDNKHNELQETPTLTQNGETNRPLTHDHHAPENRA